MTREDRSLISQLIIGLLITGLLIWWLSTLPPDQQKLVLDALEIIFDD